MFPSYSSHLLPLSTPLRASRLQPLPLSFTPTPLRLYSHSLPISTLIAPQHTPHHCPSACHDFHLPLLHHCPFHSCCQYLVMTIICNVWAARACLITFLDNEASMKRAASHPGLATDVADDHDESDGAHSCCDSPLLAQPLGLPGDSRPLYSPGPTSLPESMRWFDTTYTSIEQVLQERGESWHSTTAPYDTHGGEHTWVLTSTFAGIGTAEMAQGYIQHKMKQRGIDIATVVWSATDRDEVCNEILCSHRGHNAPCHVYGDVLGRIPPIHLRRLQMAQQRQANKFKSAIQTALATVRTRLLKITPHSSWTKPSAS